MKPTDFSKYLSDYLTSYLPSLRNLSKNTIKSYCDTFKLLLMFFRDTKKMKIERLMLKDITADLINEFCAWLKDERGCGISTPLSQDLTSPRVLKAVTSMPSTNDASA